MDYISDRLYITNRNQGVYYDSRFYSWFKWTPGENWVNWKVWSNDSIRLVTRFEAAMYDLEFPEAQKATFADIQR